MNLFDYRNMHKKKTILFFQLFIVVLTITFGCGKIQWDLDKTNSTISVEITEVYNITATNATLKYKIYSQNDPAISRIEIEYYSISNSNSVFTVIVNSNDVEGQASLVNLNASTDYKVRLKVQVEEGYLYSEYVEFTTNSTSNQTSNPSITLSVAQSITATSASFGITVLNTNQNITNSGLVYGLQSNPTTSNNSVFQTNTALTNYNLSLTNLIPGTLYYVRGFVVVNGLTYYSTQRTFTTSTSTSFASLVGSNNCSSLAGFTTFYSGINSATGTWGLGAAHVGNGLIAPNPNNSGNLGITSGTHYISFSRQFQNSGYIEFWANSYNPGTYNIIPTVSINNGAAVEATSIGGQSSSFFFIKLRSQIIPAGTNNIKIQFNGSNSIFKIDEIQFFEY